MIRYTALSLPHALSASEVPMATMKVTYVVESGSFRDVPKAIRLLATNILTDPLRRSNDEASAGFRSFFL